MQHCSDSDELQAGQGGMEEISEVVQNNYSLLQSDVAHSQMLSNYCSKDRDVYCILTTGFVSFFSPKVLARLFRP